MVPSLLGRLHRGDVAVECGAVGWAGTYEAYVVESNCPLPVVTAELEIAPLPEVIASNFGPIEVEHCPDNTPHWICRNGIPVRCGVDLLLDSDDENTIEFGEAGPGWWLCTTAFTPRF